MGFFPYMGEVLWVFVTFMEVFPIPPLSRGIPGGEERAYQAGACSYLMKPYNPAVLLEVKKALETKGRQALEAPRTNVGMPPLPS